MKKIVSIAIAALLSAFIFAGCGAAANEPSQENTVTPTAPAPERKTDYEIILKDAPPDFEIDSRYTYLDFDSDTPFVIYEDSNNPVDPPISDSMIALGRPTFKLYMYYDSKGIAQFRAYGEKFEVTYEGSTKTFADKPVKIGIYKVAPEIKTADGENIIAYNVLDTTPIKIEDEDFPTTETETDGPVESAKTTPTSANTGSSGSGTGSSQSSGSSGAGNGGNSGGSNNHESETGGSRSSGTTWHDAVYEDVWIVDVPACTKEEPVYDTVEWFECNCGATFSSESEIWAHSDQHLINGEPDAYSVKSEKRQVGTNTISIPEQGHWEKKLVREAGYY